jgi:PAS domain S-box-containing protein
MKNGHITDSTDPTHAADVQSTAGAADHERNFVTAVLEMAGALMIVLDRAGRIVRFNQACERVSGYLSEEVEGRLLWETALLPAEDLPTVQAVFARLVSGRFPDEYENDWITRDGRRRLIAWSNSAIVDTRGKVSHVIAIGVDVTARRQMEEEKNRLLAEISQQRTQLRHLARQVVRAQEEERSRVARELHDEAGQALTVLKYSLSAALRELSSAAGPDLAALAQRLQKAARLCDATTTQIRLLAHDLRPTTLDNVGLNLTLEGLCQDFAESTGLAMDYAGVDVLSLGAAIDITLYRLLQEALTNVARHAHAAQVWVGLHVDDAEVCLSIEDDGRGFNANSWQEPEQRQAERLQGLGLLGMRERVEALHGLLEIDSKPGQGTLIVCHIPLRSKCKPGEPAGGGS